MNKRTVLITGGAKRVGKEIALSLANKNTNIIIHYNKSLNCLLYTSDAADDC